MQTITIDYNYCFQHAIIGHFILHLHLDLNSEIIYILIKKLNMGQVNQQYTKRNSLNAYIFLKNLTNKYICYTFSILEITLTI